MEEAVYLLLSLWFSLSVAYQVRWISSRLGRYDPFGLLPKWTFFAPNPGTNDHHVIFRECRASDDLSEPVAWQQHSELISQWKELEIAAFDCPNIPLVWHPSRRVSKVLSDLVNSLILARRLHEDFSKFMELWVEYLMITNLVDEHARPGTQFQWALVRSHGFGDRGEVRIVLLSRFHLKALV